MSKASSCRTESCNPPIKQLGNTRMGVTVREVKVQDLGFRWGSFGSDGRVSFHWKAVLLPPRIAQYVVVH
ncbi:MULTISPECIES: M48 metallopeptidase family protein [unclassified Ochrobactrum]|uniref:M48 metallopeptidase family protein n=1 Tax=unclassified Ochrobactrum TaxID=239106 RepID=UPI004045DB68